MLIHDLCEARNKTPADFELLTFDQLLLMALDRNTIRSRSRTIEVSPEELVMRGVMAPSAGGQSYLMRRRQERAREEDRRKRREQREERRRQRERTEGKQEGG